MQTLQFKTNIKCGGCVAAVTPYLDKIGGQWNVDTNDPDKILSIETQEAVMPEKVVAALEQAGYKAEQL